MYSVDFTLENVSTNDKLGLRPKKKNFIKPKIIISNVIKSKN